MNHMFSKDIIKIYILSEWVVFVFKKKATNKLFLYKCKIYLWLYSASKDTFSKGLIVGVSIASFLFHSHIFTHLLAFHS